jgi:hypothetical protein
MARDGTEGRGRRGAFRPLPGRRRAPRWGRSGRPRSTGAGAPPKRGRARRVAPVRRSGRRLLRRGVAVRVDRSWPHPTPSLIAARDHRIHSLTPLRLLPIRGIHFIRILIGHQCTDDAPEAARPSRTRNASLDDLDRAWALLVQAAGSAGAGDDKGQIAHQLRWRAVAKSNIFVNKPNETKYFYRTSTRLAVG